MWVITRGLCHITLVKLRAKSVSRSPTVHYTKNHIFFPPNVLKRWSFKKIALEYDLSCIIRKRWYFLFPKIWFYSLEEKWKMIFLEKDKWKYDIFCKCSKKTLFPKNSHCNMIFLQLSGKMIFLFPGNMISFFISLLRTDMFNSSYIIANYVFSKSNLYRYVLLKMLVIL